MPLDSTAFPTQLYQHDFNGTNKGRITAKQREQIGENTTFDTYKFYDGFGRLIQTRYEAINNQQIVVDIYYDEDGRIKEQSNPYFASFSGVYATPSQTVNRTIYDYDQLDRVINITNADGTIKSISYVKGNISVYDENNNRRDYEIDGFKRIIQVREYKDNDTYKTNYNYDSADNIIKITDALSNIITYSYDTLGRKIGMNDPDLGIWNYTYDKAGNLIQHTDARNKSIRFAYDSLNRKISEDDLSLITISYIYDSGKNNTLSQVEVPNNNIFINYTYDGRLRKTHENKSITGIKSLINWAYDSSDRVTTQTLPDGRIITYSYNDQGLLSSINGIADIVYNENNDPLGISYSNNLDSNYTYNPANLRLKRIKTEGKQELNYSYDYVGNVMQINDSINNRTTTMEYDDLNRLTYTKIVDSAQNYLIYYAYNAIGNMLNSSINGDRTAFFYGTRPIHSPSSLLITINNNPPSTPRNLYCNSAPCTNNQSFINNIEINCSGSIDAEEDSITYFIDAYYNLNSTFNWWNSNWERRKPVTINSSYNITNHSIKLEIIHDSDMQSDFEDLRFVNNENQELKYWIEEKYDGINATLWVKTTLRDFPNNTIYIYYNNTLATTTSKMEDVFLFADQFNNSDYTDNWQVDEGAWQEANDVLKLSNLPEGASGQIISGHDFSNVKVGWKAKYHNGQKWGAVTLRGDRSDPGYDLFYMVGSGYGNAKAFMSKDFSVPFESVGGILEYNIFYRWNVWINGTTLNATVEEASIQDVESTYTNGYFGLISYASFSGGGDVVSYDWVYVRNYTNPEPFPTIGNEETQTGYSWHEIGNHADNTAFNWSMSSLPHQTEVDLRCKAIDLQGSNIFSSYLDPAINITIN